MNKQKLIDDFEAMPNKFTIDFIVLLDRLSEGNGAGIFESFVPEFKLEDNSERTSYISVLMSKVGKHNRNKMYTAAIRSVR